MNWVKIKDIAEIYRGGIESPLGAKRAIHTCNQGGGIWKRCDDSSPLLADSSLKGIREGDLLIKRVGRNCARSSGMAIDLEGLACSDCVLIMRPKNGISSTEMLFALRFLLCSCGLTQLIERGTGASYITENGLRNLMIPIGLCRDHPLKYMKYCYAVNQDSALMMRSIEDQLSKIYNSCLFNTG